MSIDQWKDIGYVCGAISALILVVGLIRQKVIMPVFETARLVSELVHQLIGDEDAKPPRPSLMQLVAEVRAQQAEQAEEQARLGRVVALLKASHEEHLSQDHRPVRSGSQQRERTGP